MITTSKPSEKLTTRLQEACRETRPARATWLVVLALALAVAIAGSAKAQTAVEQASTVAGPIPPGAHEAATGMILSALERTKQYPDAAHVSHKALDGRAVVAFDVDDGRHPQHIEVVHRSGNSAFDR